MRSLSVIALMLLTAVVTAQVQVDKALRATSSDAGERQIDGLAPPVQEDALMTLGNAQDGAVHWAQVAGTVNAITLALDPPATAYDNGMLLRFLPTVNATGPVTLNVNGLGARKLLRPDLLSVSAGQVRSGSPVEVQYADSVFILLSRAEGGCPPGYLLVTSQYCIQQGENNNQTWLAAVSYCADRGARLCTWDEYFHACTLHSATMTGMFDDWEWYDDTADHTHTAVQGGRWTCQSERSVGIVGEIHASRCCYRLR